MVSTSTGDIFENLNDVCTGEAPDLSIVTRGGKRCASGHLLDIRPRGGQWPGRDTSPDGLQQAGIPRGRWFGRSRLSGRVRQGHGIDLNRDVLFRFPKFVAPGL